MSSDRSGYCIKQVRILLLSHAAMMLVLKTGHLQDWCHVEQTMYRYPFNTHG